MCGEGDGAHRMPWFLDMPVGQALAVAHIMDCVKGKSVVVADLPLGSDEEKLELTMALHSWGALLFFRFRLPGAAVHGHQACVALQLSFLSSEASNEPHRSGNAPHLLQGCFAQCRMLRRSVRWSKGRWAVVQAKRRRQSTRRGRHV